MKAIQQHKIETKLEEEIAKFFDVWSMPDIVQFLRDTIHLFELYDVEDEGDWVEKEVGKDNEMNVRIIRTVYLLSILCDSFAGKMVKTNCAHPKLWRRLEAHARKNGNSSNNTVG